MIVVEFDGVFGARFVRSEFKNGVNGGDRKRDGAGGDGGQIRGTSDEKEPEIRGRKVQSDAKIIERRNEMGGVGVGIIGSGDGEILVEDLVDEGGVGELRWVTERQRGKRRFNEIGMNVLGLIAAVEHEVLEE